MTIISRRAARLRQLKCFFNEPMIAFDSISRDYRAEAELHPRSNPILKRENGVLAQRCMSGYIVLGHGKLHLLLAGRHRLHAVSSTVYGRSDGPRQAKPA